MKKIVVFVVGVGLILVVFYIARDFRNEVERETSRLVDRVSQTIRKTFEDKVKEEVKDIVGDIKKSADEVRREVSAPTPLVVEKTLPPDTSPNLTKVGVLTWTNYERSLNKISPLLIGSPILDQVAKQKLDDMFKRQYFEHISPTGEGAGDLADQIGYDFLSIGENLALGEFEDDQKLVEAWMNSPGHRANILNPKYQELGVAVGKGIFEGQSTWLAVQIFGKPASACPKVDNTLREKIEANKSKIADRQRSAESLRNEIESEDPQTKEEVDLYNQKVEQYNALVAEINSLVTETKSLIADYNNQVQAFNTCLAL